MESRSPAPSVTALLVTQGLLANARRNHLVSLDASRLAEYFIKYAHRNYPSSLGLTTSKAIGLYSPYTENMFVKIYSSICGISGYAEHMATRKWFIEEQVTAAIRDGVTQVIILGGGFDTLALRKHMNFPNVDFYELDLGGTRACKLAALESLKFPNPKNILEVQLQRFGEYGKNMHFVACDLSLEDWHVTLQRFERFSKKKDTIVVIEGVTMYLTVLQVEAMLRSVRENILSDKSKVVLSFSAPHEPPKLTKLILKNNNENYNCFFRLQEALDFLNPLQYSMLGKVDAHDLQHYAGTEITEHLGSEYYVMIKPSTPKDNPIVYADDVPTLLVRTTEEARQKIESCCVIL